MTLRPGPANNLIQKDLIGITVVGETIVLGPRISIAAAVMRRVLHDGRAARAPRAVSGRGEPVAEPGAVQEGSVGWDAGADDGGAELDGAPHDAEGD